MAEDVRECRDSVRELATATNGKMDRVHRRIDTLMILALSTLLSSVGGLVVMLLKTGGK